VTASPRELAENLRERARAAGFDRAGVASLEPLEHGAAFLRWLERGEHAGMGYLAQRVEKRLRPELVLPGARSALYVALRYHPLEGSEEPAGDLWPRVARYARGRDYHNLMGKRLKRLAREIRADYPGCDTRVYVDTGPVLERELAARAGLGVAGKNTCLLNREGSYFLLGEIFLTLSLEPDEPLTDLCGRCTRCLEACPTDALREPYRLDSNRCISYWTIEHRGSVPREMRPQIEDWVFGCDICQEVCPWNLRPSGASDHPDLHLPERRGRLDLVQLLALGPDAYQERFQGSAMQRARREGLQRNAATAMGNRRDERYVPALGQALVEAEDEAVRGHAAWALGRIGGKDARHHLARALARETETAVLEEIRSALETS
jgi:epoxyqueuosine reductase